MSDEKGKTNTIYSINSFLHLYGNTITTRIYLINNIND